MRVSSSGEDASRPSFHRQMSTFLSHPPQVGSLSSHFFFRNLHGKQPGVGLRPISTMLIEERFGLANESHYVRMKAQMETQKPLGCASSALVYPLQNQLDPARCFVAPTGRSDRRGFWKNIKLNATFELNNSYSCKSAHSHVRIQDSLSLWRACEDPACKVAGCAKLFRILVPVYRYTFLGGPEEESRENAHRL